jgi:exodeoxyribonuclease V gamma subunit
MPMKITFSNRFEYLLEALLLRLANETPGPFDAQTVIVPSIAVRRRIELTAADRFGVCARIDFPFLGQWLWQETSRWMETPERSPLDRGRLTWGLYASLGDGTFVDRFPQLRSYLASADAGMRLELAERIASVFDDVLTYRETWVEAWRAHAPLPNVKLDSPAEAETANWLGELWRRVTSAFGLSQQHPFLRLLSQDTPPAVAKRPSLPVHVFALPALPPLNLKLLRKFAGYRELHIHTLNPCREYWFDIVPQRRLSFLAAKGRTDYHEVGNRLLASWGRQTKDHIDLLFENDEGLVEDGSAFFESGSTSLLGQLQDAILDLQELAPGSVETEDGDRSIELHVSHSMTRQLEALQDRLLGLMSGADPIRPEDVLVVLPDLKAAAPMIDAVFGTAPPERRIPYTITGRGQTRENPVARTLAALLALLPGRFPASMVFDLLQQRPIAMRYGLDDAGLETLRDWIAEAGIRWGLDADQRAELALPELDFHSFADGIERLFLAYAIGDDAQFLERSGAGNPEGQGAQALGSLWRFVQDLADTRRRWRTPRLAEAWRTEIEALLERFIPPAFEWAEDLRSLRATVAELERQMSAAGDTALAPEVVIRALAESLEQPARGGVPTGGLSFAAMASLRPLPYRMICVLGLDDGVFPGVDRPAEFDLLAKHYQRGDRQRRDDERNLFLDLLLGARDHFYMSHTGRSLRDNAPLPASILATELIDLLADATASDPDDPAAVAEARARLVVEHPLQPFSAELFRADGDLRIRSHNAELCGALREGLSATHAATALPRREESFDEEDEGPDLREAPPFFALPLPLPADAREVPLDAFLRFFRNPSRALLRERLGIQIVTSDDALADEEPFVAGYAERQALTQRLEAAVLAGEAFEALAARSRTGNEYPAGAIGTQQREQHVAELAAVSAALAPLREEAALPPVPVSLSFELDDGDWRLVGNLAQLRASGQTVWRLDDLRASDRIDAVLRHLVLCAVRPAGVETTTTHIACDQPLTLPTIPQNEARSRLATLLAHYRTGLTRPLRFFPRSAWAYVENDLSSGDARRKWDGGQYAGESADPYYELAMRGVIDPLDEEFEQIAVDVFELAQRAGSQK